MEGKGWQICMYWGGEGGERENLPNPPANNAAMARGKHPATAQPINLNDSVSIVSWFSVRWRYGRIGATAGEAKKRTAICCCSGGNLFSFLIPSLWHRFRPHLLLPASFLLGIGERKDTKLLNDGHSMRWFDGGRQLLLGRRVPVAERGIWGGSRERAAGGGRHGKPWPRPT